MCNSRLFLRVLEVIFALTVCTPLCVLFWSGTWKLVDLYIFPEQRIISSWVSFAVGSFIATISYFIAELFRNLVTVECSFPHVLLSRILIYVNAFGHLNYWRGVWYLSDNLLGKGLLNCSLSFFISHFALMLLRSSCNSPGQPFAVTFDKSEDFYKTAPRFRTQIARPFYFTADVLFTQFINATLGIQVWRSLWNILDATVLPNDHLKSYYLSLGIGFGASALLLSAEEAIRRLSVLCKRHHWLLALLVEDIAHFLAVIAGVVLWRGGWGLMKDYVIIGSRQLVDGWLYHAAGMGGLMMLNIGSTVSPLGCSLDMEGDFEWGIRYFTLMCSSDNQQELSVQVPGDVSDEVESDDEPLLGGNTA